MTGVWLSIADVESLITEARLDRNRYDPATRRQRDAANAQRNARKKWDPLKPDD
jgi:hypothetical protein